MPALVVAAYFGTAFNVLLVLAAAFPVIFAFGADRSHRDGIVGSMGVTLLGIVWIGIPLVHAVLLRELPDHGAALMVDVLVGTFAADTGAYADRPHVRLPQDRPQPLAQQDARGPASAAS